MLWTRRPPLLVGVLVAAVGVALTTLLVYALKDIAPVLSLGVVYLLVVLVVATVWGAWLALATAVASASQAPQTVATTSTTSR
jgi:two-component system sensor histidine kinase KdpD